MMEGFKPARRIKGLLHQPLCSRETEYAKNIQSQLLGQFLSNSDLCDVTIAFGNEEIKAHWCVLVLSPYFRSMLDSGLSEKAKGRILISPKHDSLTLSQFAIRTALQFLYSGKIKCLTFDKVKEVHAAADYFQIEDLVKDCIRFMRHAIRMHTVQEVLQVAERYGCEDLKKECLYFLTYHKADEEDCIVLLILTKHYDLKNFSEIFEYVITNLPKCLQQDHSLDLTPCLLMEILEDKRLDCAHVPELFNFIVKWIMVNEKDRGGFFKNMFFLLDFKQTSRNFIEESVKMCPLVQNTEGCKQHVENICTRECQM